MNIKQSEIENVIDNYKRLERLTAENEISIEAVASALTGLCPEADFGKLLEDCRRMEKGISMFRELYLEYGDADNVVLADALIAKAVEGKTPAECKGVYLQYFEEIRAKDAGISVDAEHVTAADLAVLPERELHDLLAEQWRNTAQWITDDVCSKLHALPAAQGESVMSEPLLLAAAQYAAFINGELHCDYDLQPEMLGAGAMAYEALRQNAKDSQDAWKDLLLGVALILAGLAFFALAGPAVHLALDAASGAVIAFLGGGYLAACAGCLLMIAAALAIYTIPIVAIIFGYAMISEGFNEKISAFYEKLRSRFVRRQYIDFGDEAESGNVTPEQEEQPVSSPAKA